MLLGLFGGLVSSTATTLASSRYARSGSEVTGLAGAVIVTANLVLLVRLAVLAAITAPGILGVLAPVLATALFAGAAVFAIGQRRNGTPQELTLPPIGNPAEMRTALGFALLYAGVLLLVAWLDALVGSKGVYAAALASGLADVDAISLTSLRLYGLGSLTPAPAATAIVLAVSANAVFKLGIVRVVGGGALFRRCLPAMAATAAGAAVGLTLFAT